MQRSMWLRRTALAAALALAATACSSDDTSDDPSASDSPTETMTDGSEEPTASETETSEPVEATGQGDGTFTLARVLPESGFLDYLGAPMIGGVALAVADMNAAGGVLGSDVELLEFDSGTSGDITATNVNNALAQGADSIVGAASSGATLGVLATLNANGIPNCSPSATSGDFNTTPTASLFFRTVPSDEFVAPIIANEIIADGNADNIVIVQLQDAYGDFIAAAVTDALSAQGVEPAMTIAYAPDETLFESQANEIAAANPSAILVVGFREASGLLNQLVEGRGLDPAIMYGADGVFSSQLDDLAEVSLDGMKLIGAAGSNEFNQRLAESGVADFLYGGQAYDCAILMGLWASAEGTDDSSQWDVQTLLDLTDGGEKCTTFADCIAIIEAGGDVDYDGASGELALQGVEGGTGGNPTKATYAVAQFQDGELVSVSSTPVDLS